MDKSTTVARLGAADPVDRPYQAAGFLEYRRHPGNGGTGGVQELITEAQLVRTIRAGARVRRAVVVIHPKPDKPDKPDKPAQLSLFVLLVGGRVWQHVALRRLESVRFWRSHKPIRELLDELDAPPWFYEAKAGCRLLARLGIQTAEPDPD